MTEQLSLQRRLYGFMIVQALAWTLVPALMRHNLPFDTVESIAWGQQWQWGYDKHPPLAAWLNALAFYAGQSWLVYLLGQLSIVLSYWGVWRLCQKILPLRLAFLATVLLSSIWYYTIESPKFNPNTLMIPLWVWTQYVFYGAYREDRLKHWLLSGFLAGLCLLTKYESAVLLLSNLSLLLLTRAGRVMLRRPYFYAALGVLVLTELPNLIWNASHGWVEVQYALGRAGDYQSVSQGWKAHFHWSSWFLLQQLGTLSLSLALLLGLIFPYKKLPIKIASKDLTYLLYQGLGPLVITLLLSLLSGMYLYAKWATPYFSFFPAMVLAVLRPAVSEKKTTVYFYIGLACILLSALIRGLYLGIGPTLFHKASADAFFPGQEISQYAETLWHEHCPSQAFKTIAGSHYLVANIHVYAPTRPTPYFDWSPTQSAWLNDKLLKQKGALFAWWSDPAHSGLPQDVAARFPKARYLGQHAFPAQAPYTKPIWVGFAYLPPPTAS